MGDELLGSRIPAAAECAVEIGVSVQELTPSGDELLFEIEQRSLCIENGEQVDETGCVPLVGQLGSLRGCLLYTSDAADDAMNV